LRWYQRQIKQDIYNAWGGKRSNVLAVLPTGAGKTVVFSDILAEHNGASCAIAHRQELVSQISVALARNGVKHRIIGPKNVIRQVVNLHMMEVGASFYDPAAPVGVAGVDTLIRRGRELSAWLNRVTLWVQDEAHHVLESNKWGQAAEMFPHAKGLGVTATPCRADRKGLGRHADGLFDVLVEGPNMRDLIDEGFLTDYRVLAPDPAFVMNDETDVGSTGDYKRDAVVKKFRASKNKVIGDVVSHYLKHAVGKLGITFVPDVEDATDTAAAFNAVGVPAEVVSAKTPDTERAEILRRFKRRELLQLVNVDLFGEGFDLPAIEVVSMARPTASFSLFVQQFGRALRLMVDPALMSQWDDFTPEQRRAHIAASDKPRALILDHVGNVQRHKLPDRRMTWTLDRGDKRQRAANDDAIPVKACPECTFVYEAVKPCCPECGYKPLPMARSRPEFVDGDLIELTPEALAALREEVDQMDKPAHQIVAEKHIPLAGQRRFARIHAEDQEAQRVLRESIAWWGGYQRAMGRGDSESYKRFYFMFGVDVMTAQTLKRAEAEALTARINDHLGDVRDAG
jgi:superfamily II DNA or RNA helicase